MANHGYRSFRGHFYEAAPEYDAIEAVQTVGRPDIAYHVYGWEVEGNEDTEWTGQMERTGRLLCVMVGDDRPWFYEPDEITPVSNYCGGCGQIGCGHGE